MFGLDLIPRINGKALHESVTVLSSIVVDNPQHDLPCGRDSSGEREDSRPKDLLHGLPFGQLIDELVQIADLLHDRLLDLLNAHTTDDAGNS